MSLQDPILKNESSKVNWSIVLKSPNAVAYKLWTKKLNEDWRTVQEGTLSDDIIDAGEFDSVKGTEFAYWLGIGSHVPNSSFNISIVLMQDNTVLKHGIIDELGKVNDNGIIQRSQTITFK